MKLNENLLKKLIAKELKSIKTESIDHEGIRSVVDTASRLMSSIEYFEEKMTPAMANSVTSCLKDLKDNITSMIENPGSYVQKEKKVISLKKQE